MSTILEQLRAFKDGFSQGGASRAEMAFPLTNAAPLGEVLEIAKQLDLRYEVEIITKTLLTRDSIATTTTTTVKIIILSPVLSGPL